MTLPAFAPFAERALSRLDRVRPSHLVLAGLLLRVAWIAVCPNAPYSDQSVYHYEAEMIAQGRGYINLEGEPTNFYPVGYPALLGAAYAIFGARYFVAYGLNLLLAVVGMAGAYRLVALLWGERAGKVATLLVAVHPTFILLATAMASENPFCAVLPWTLWLIARLTREPRAPWLAPAAGVAVAAMTFLRPPALLLLSCPAVFGLLARQPLRRWVLDSVIACAFALMVLAPWGLRNQRDFGRFSLTSFNAGINLYMGNNPDSHGDWTDDLPVDIDVLPQPLSDLAFQKRAREYIVTHPARYVELCLDRLYVSMRSDTIAPVWDRVGITRRFGKGAILVLKVVCSVFHWALLLGLAATLWRAGRRHFTRGDRQLAWAAALMAAPFTLIVGGNRYMLPFMMVVCLWTASFARTDQSEPAPSP